MVDNFMTYLDDTNAETLDDVLIIEGITNIKSIADFSKKSIQNRINHNTRKMKTEKDVIKFLKMLNEQIILSTALNSK